MTELILLPTFDVLANSSIIEKKAVETLKQKLPEIIDKSNSFGRHNSQSTVTMMTLTMLNGQSPMRVVRQILAEIESRRLALSESQVSFAEIADEIEKLQDEPSTNVVEAKLRNKRTKLYDLEGKINGAIKDIAILCDTYELLKEKHGLDNWDETDFENAEKRHHIRRGFELLYRNMIQAGRAQESSIEYLQQYGVHIQIALAEVSGYINYTETRIQAGDRPTASDLEDFLDQMSEKYLPCADEASERLFGKAEITNKEYMKKTRKVNTNE